VQDVEPDVADHEVVSVAQEARVRGGGEGVLPPGVALVGEEELRSRARPSSRLPETKSAWMCVSVTCVIRSPSSAAARTYSSTSRLGSTTIASPVAAHPIR
jgi:hypothetical protein